MVVLFLEYAVLIRLESPSTKSLWVTFLFSSPDKLHTTAFLSGVEFCKQTKKVMKYYCINNQLMPEQNGSHIRDDSWFVFFSFLFYKSHNEVWLLATWTQRGTHEQPLCVSALSALVQVMLVACSAPSHYLNQCWLFINWTVRNKLQWIRIKIQKSLFTKMHLNMSSGK